MRQDVEKLLRQDGVHPWGAVRRQLEELCGMPEEKEKVILVLLGRLEVYHGAITVPERLNAAVCVTDRGVYVLGRVWKNRVSFRKPWDRLEKFDTSSGNGFGLRIALSDGNTKYQFWENYRGKISERHKDELETAKRVYYYKDEESESWEGK